MPSVFIVTPTAIIDDPEPELEESTTEEDTEPVEIFSFNAPSPEQVKFFSSVLDGISNSTKKVQDQERKPISLIIDEIN